jgi:glyoxylase-like metal-dependent hydrolase (beta-lactamase superfamily II)
MRRATFQIMIARVDVVSIGTLARNLLWNEASAVRTAHATVSLIRTGKDVILVDPGLPPVALGARLAERMNLKPAQVTHVFLTHVGPATTAGLELFEHATWYCSEAELTHLRNQMRGYDGDDPRRAAIDGLLRRVEPAPDQVGRQVDLFPLAGVTRGTCGLLVAGAVNATLVTGPAVATLDHFLAGQVLPESADVEQAKSSLQEVYEIADLVVPGFDNVFQNPRGFGI